MGIMDKCDRRITGFDMTIKRKTGKEKQEQAKEEKKISAVVKSLVKLDEVVKTAGISEKEAEALEALLGSIRFFVAQQTSDVTAIKNLLEARYALESQEANTKPMLVELRAQTNYLEVISDRIDRVFATSSNSKGAGLRVFIG